MDKKLHKQYRTASEDHFWFKVRDNILQDIAEKYFQKGDKVLDFGCNYGHSTKFLQNLGYKAEGVDVEKEAIEYGRSLGIADLNLTGEKSFPPNYFDAIITLDVLEHIEDDKEAMEYLNSILKKEGLLVIMVPAFMFLWSSHDNVAHHFRRYTMNGLINLSKKTGQFEVVKKTYFNTILFLPILFLRWTIRLFSFKPVDSDISRNNSLFNKIFFWIFDLERRIIKYIKLSFGVSILLVLRKK